MYKKHREKKKKQREQKYLKYYWLSLLLVSYILHANCNILISPIYITIEGYTNSIGFVTQNFLCIEGYRRLGLTAKVGILLGEGSMYNIVERKQKVFKDTNVYPNLTG